MHEKNRSTKAALSFASLGIATLAIAISAYNTFKLSELPTQSQLNSLEEKLASQMKEGDAEFEKRVESALESIVERRRAEMQNKQREAKTASAINSEGMLSMNSEQQVVYGNPDAPVTVYTFSDFRCTFCERYHPTIQEFVNNSDGQVNWIYKPYPVLGPASEQLAAAAECVAQIEGPEAFWRFSEQAYATKNWITAVKYSELLDAEKVLNCTTENTYGARINKSLQEGRDLNITGTPASVFRNNKTEKGALIPGFIQQDQIARMVQEVLGE